MPGPDPSPSRGLAKRARQRGQVLAIFAGAMVLFVGVLAVVVDVSWYWSNTLKVQRAADAAALAGACGCPASRPRPTRRPTTRRPRTATRRAAE